MTVRPYAAAWYVTIVATSLLASAVAIAQLA